MTQLNGSIEYINSLSIKELLKHKRCQWHPSISKAKQTSGGNGYDVLTKTKKGGDMANFLGGIMGKIWLARV